jgi:asparagine synthase (glutamine-hydrolysing)
MGIQMSAITGIHQFNTDSVSSDQAFGLMKVFQQFPADKVETWSDHSIFLGCHAQWITPESIGESNPYFNYERNLAITADAIIDNREELFNQLQIHYEDRLTLPDTQLILLAYCKWGEETPKHLIGDFAFMIWDRHEQKLFGARDFSGSRTLYYYHDYSRFVFSTLIEPLFRLPYINKSLNEEWLAEFIAIPTMVEAVDMNSTVYKQVKQLPPSHSISVKEGKVTLSRYLTLAVVDKLKLKSNAEYEEAFKEVFQKAVKVRLRTHGKVGSHLSGGMDSGTVVSFAARELQKQNKRLNTYSYIPEDDFVDWTPKYYIPDERPFIKETVNYVGNINDQYLNFKGQSPYTEVDDFLSLMEMPYKFFENSYWLKGLSQKAHKDGVKILLSGARGNHSISWGSYQLTIDYYAELFRKLKWVRLANELDKYCINFRTGKSYMLPVIAKNAFPQLAQVLSRKAHFQYSFPSFLNPSLAQRTKVYEKLADYGVRPVNGTIASNLLDHRKNHYQQLFTWNKSGTANTKLSLRYSVWERDPTNDLNVIRFCLAVPDEQYVQDGMERSFLRRVTKDILPDKVRMNHHARGIQGADTVHRMSAKWEDFHQEIESLTNASLASELLKVDIVKSALTAIGRAPGPEVIFGDDFKIVTRSLILYKFIKSMERR